MKEIILDYSANTHKNDLKTIEHMINAITAIDSGKHKIIFKSQLFKEAGKNVPCTKEAFNFMYSRCRELGYGCTASVFDKESLDYLLEYDIPFVKIANNKDLHYLLDFIPRKYKVYISNNSSSLDTDLKDKRLCNQDEIFHCVSKYPAKIEDYRCFNASNISDHTEGLELFKTRNPIRWEKHLKGSNSTGLDSGPFSITPEELKEIL